MTEKKTLNDEDYTINDIARICKVSYQTASEQNYYGEYLFNGKRRIRKEVFDNRRDSGLDVTVQIKAGKALLTDAFKQRF